MQVTKNEVLALNALAILNRFAEHQDPEQLGAQMDDDTVYDLAVLPQGFDALPAVRVAIDGLSAGTFDVPIDVVEFLRGRALTWNLDDIARSAS